MDWIAKNPTTPFSNKTNLEPLSDFDFNELMKMIIHNCNSSEEKLELLLMSKGFFSAEQAARCLLTFVRAKDKLKCIMILEPARSILSSFNIHEDRLESLQYVKRALSDANTQNGIDSILSCFTFENHKLDAIKIINSVVAEKGLLISAGGHMSYGPLGSLYTNSPPNNNHLYGLSIHQIVNYPGDNINPVGKNISGNSLYSTNNPKYSFG